MTEKKVADTDTTNRKFPHKLLINRLIPETVPVITPPINPQIVDGVAASGGNLHARQTITSTDIVTDAVCSCARIF